MEKKHEEDSCSLSLKEEEVEEEMKEEEKKEGEKHEEEMKEEEKHEEDLKLLSLQSVNVPLCAVIDTRVSKTQLYDTAERSCTRRCTRSCTRRCTRHLLDKSCQLRHCPTAPVHL